MMVVRSSIPFPETFLHVDSEDLDIIYEEAILVDSSSLVRDLLY